MKLAAARVDAFLKAPDPAIFAVLIYGPDRGLARERAETLIAAYGVSPDDAFAFASLEEAAVASGATTIEDELRAMAFSGGTRVARLRVNSDGLGERIAGTLRDLDSGAFEPASRLIVEAGDLGPRTKLRVAFEGAKTALALPCYEDSPADLDALIATWARERGLALDPDTLAYLAPRLTGDRALARNELEKLALYLGPDATNVEVNDIDAVVTGAEPADLDAFVDAVVGGRPNDADQALSRALAGGTTGVGLVRALQRRLLQLNDVAAKSRRGGLDAAVAVLRPPIFGPRRAAFLAQARAWSPAAIEAALGEVLRAEQRLKSAGAVEAAVVGRLALVLARAARR